MIPPFDIFKVESSGLRWMEAAPDLERAKTRVRVLSASSPGEYIILNQITGEKITIQPKSKRIVFQIGYEERGMKARAELLRLRCGSRRLPGGRSGATGRRAPSCRALHSRFGTRCVWIWAES